MNVDLAGLEARMRHALADPSRVADGPGERQRYGADLSLHRSEPPDLVVRPQTTAEVAAVVRLAGQTGAPIVATGARTSLEGQTLPVRGGIVLDMGGMDAIASIDPADLTATVRPGVLRSQLEAALAPHGLWFPVASGADASVGGMIATNASGTTTIRYGDMRGQVRELELVLASGEIARVGTRASKSSAGYRLCDLVVGSEGTLAIVTEATVRVHPRPAAGASAVAAFPSVQAVCRAATELVAAGANLLRAELLERRTVEAVNAYCGSTLPAADLLLIDFAGSQAGIEQEIGFAREAVSRNGGASFRLEETDEGRERLWAARHQAAYAVMAQAPGKRMWTTDTCVPLSALPAAVSHARGVLGEVGLDGAIAAHAGDGNLHVLIGVDPEDPADRERVDRIGTELVRHALAAGGTCSAEHGIGLGKLDHLEREHGATLGLMRQIKDVLDPAGLLNPGKVLR